jgi:hypothetical protein
MTYWMNPTPLDKLPPGTWPALTVPVTAVVLDATIGRVTLINVGGRVRSLQPGDGTNWADRDPGTAGVYECAILTPQVVTYQPDVNAPPHQYAIGLSPN